MYFVTHFTENYDETGTLSQSTYIPTVPQCPSPRPNWDPHTPSPESESVSPKETKRGEEQSPATASEGVPISNSDDRRKSKVYSVVFIVHCLAT